MNLNLRPRLRHFWRHAEALNQGAPFARSLPDRPYVLRHETLGGGIEYVRAGGKDENPYAAEFHDVPIPGGFGSCALFPVGQDEGVAEAMFLPPGQVQSVPLPTANRFDALLIVRSRIRFVFKDADHAKGQTDVPPDVRLTTVWGLVQRLYSGTYRVYNGFRFGLSGEAPFSRIAIILQPLLAYGVAKPTDAPDDLKLIFTSRVPPPPNPFAGPVGATVNLDLVHYNPLTLLRAILGEPTSAGSPPAVKESELDVGDFANIERLVRTKLGSTHVVIPI